MSKNNQPFILYDNQIFDIQRFGGISRYFCEIMRRLSMKQLMDWESIVYHFPDLYSNTIENSA